MEEQQIAVKCVDVTHDAIAEQQVWREITVNKLLVTVHCSHIVPYRGNATRTDVKRISTDAGGIDRRRRSIYIYSDFTTAGDIDHIRKAHYGLTQQHERERPVPEHFICKWTTIAASQGLSDFVSQCLGYTLKGLVEALFALQEGTCIAERSAGTHFMPDSGDYDIGSSVPWKPILHLDIKNANIFLDKINEEYASYPKPLLADFDISIIEPLHADDLHFARNCGTRGWRPPVSKR